MKSFNVKSNAKRFARGIAAKHQGIYIAAEPEPVVEGAREWFPALTIIGEESAAVAQEVRATCVMTNDEDENEPADVTVKMDNNTDDADIVTAGVDIQTEGVKTETKRWQDDAIETLAAGGEVRIVMRATGKQLRDGTEPPATVTMTKPAEISSPMAPARVGKITTLAALAATLPPPVVSTPEEIEARRAERRARIEMEKANPVQSPSKISRKQIILDLVSHKNGATAEELEAATGWQRHTLRGYIAGTLRKELAPKLGIECVRKKGEPTRYVMTAKGGDA